MPINRVEESNRNQKRLAAYKALSEREVRRGVIAVNHGIQDSHKLAGGVFERLDRMELALKRKFQEEEAESFVLDVFPIDSMFEFEEVNEKLKQFQARKSLVNFKLRFCFCFWSFLISLCYTSEGTTSINRRKQSSEYSSQNLETSYREKLR